VRFVTCRVDGGERAGVIEGDHIVLFPPRTALVDLLGDLHAAAGAAGPERIPLATARLLAPIPRPPTVRDFYAFEQHVKTARQRRGLEMEPDWYELPVFYFSNPYATIGPGVSVTAPPGCEELDYELEVAAIVGRAGENLSPEEAESHIAGYCVMNDWSARDIQRREMKLSLGPAKGKDFATSLGPWLVTPDELEPFREGKAFELAMTASVNGVEYSRASLADIHWSFGEMIAYASQSTSVQPGDVIGSGTCGTGCILELSLVHGTETYPWLRPGDGVMVEVEHLGRLFSRVMVGTGR
jgi:2-keto-4-pentenoate hydratase/2-oxohepta-3-ene-1,7-dioic acid hydratase in catechol pathway